MEAACVGPDRRQLAAQGIGVHLEVFPVADGRIVPRRRVHQQPLGLLNLWKELELGGVEVGAAPALVLNALAGGVEGGRQVPQHFVELGLQLHHLGLCLGRRPRFLAKLLVQAVQLGLGGGNDNQERGAAAFNGVRLVTCNAPAYMRCTSKPIMQAMHQQTHNVHHEPNEKNR